MSACLKKLGLGQLFLLKDSAGFDRQWPIRGVKAVRISRDCIKLWAGEQVEVEGMLRNDGRGLERIVHLVMDSWSLLLSLTVVSN